MSEVKQQRYKVTVRCHECNEKYILRGRRNKDGEFDTGFKRCVCGNEERLKIEAYPE